MNRNRTEKVARELLKSLGEVWPSDSRQCDAGICAGPGNPRRRRLSGLYCSRWQRDRVFKIASE